MAIYEIPENSDAENTTRTRVLLPIWQWKEEALLEEPGFFAYGDVFYDGKGQGSSYMWFMGKGGVSHLLHLSQEAGAVIVELRNFLFSSDPEIWPRFGLSRALWFIGEDDTTTIGTAALSFSADGCEDLTIGSRIMKLPSGFRNVLDLATFDDRTGRIVFMIQSRIADLFMEPDRSIIVFS